MKHPFSEIFTPDYDFVVFPGDVARLIEQLEGPRIDTFKQWTGDTIWAVTFGAGEDWSRKKKLFVSRPHAHEPAGVAACAELIRALAGLGIYAQGWDAWRETVLEEFVITLVPDANPMGSVRAPVTFWDGSHISNERFFLWMFGESGEEVGARFPRVACWDKREVTEPALLGIAYEQIDAHTFVEPNRDYRSTFFKSFFELNDRYHYEVWLDLHQTEFVNSDRNCDVHLRTCLYDLPAVMQDKHQALGEALHACWRRAGGVPRDTPSVPYQNNEIQKAFLNTVWRPISEKMVHAVTEIQNNNPKTPNEMQVHLQLAALMETLHWMRVS
ncbi:MAG: hypothetical protein HOH77_08955 [Candidatus Latescibacteria bacterium]|nr:hypothetical protein [Candidatus Latescibacterota bacterium]